MNKESLKDRHKTWFHYKVMEFNELGYKTISKEDLSHYFVDYKWKKKFLKIFMSKFFKSIS